MAQIETLYVHRDSWDSIASEDMVPGVTIWSAHRPLRGEVTWEQSNMGWGMHFASHRQSREDYASTAEWNRKQDAREVVLLSNMDSVVLAGKLAVEQGRADYGLAAYVSAYPGAEGAKMFVETYDLPWDDADTTADALLAALATA